ncbi:hypothetical protein AKG11_28305 [Shinella sp. SUS2]|uniref:transposase domain-containing protein n=1 Tax=unclassified Shinella TaxID=2643062 RepID=UPI0006816015|nr:MULTISPECIES: transposase domain-containing protein [unclassified Shinella]KNY13638.1 hypothetical protein AKG11_28305 [Shinella sp. SUS2]KOC72531.1 hypothetical protein AKG10_27170 [Shinella sp. GWS1]
MKEWFTIPELAGLKLPGLPTTERGIHGVAGREGWQAQEGKAQRLQARGGGFEYHVSLLPSLAQAKLARIEAVEKSRDESRQSRRALHWRVFEAMPEEHRQLAHRRHALIVAAEKAMAERELLGTLAPPMDETLAPLLRKFKVSKSTYYSLRQTLNAVDREDWLPALAPKYEDGTVSERAPMDPRAWAALKSDYLRPEKPGFSACYRRMVKGAKKNGWTPIASESALRRRMDAEVPRAVRVLTREGRKRAEQLYPTQIRTKTHLHAMELVNTDGHKLDLFVKVPWRVPEANRKVSDRVILIGMQDIYSSKILSWRLCEAETWDVVRLCIGDMIEDYGIPEHLYMDNGRAFASKMISGQAEGRHRFKKIEGEVAGLLKTLDIEPHFTKPYSGQSKPIERAWKDLAEEISKHPAMSGAYTGNKPDAKPENYQKWAVPLDVLERHVAECIAEHNARVGRKAETAKGRSFDETFAESMRHPATIVRRASDAQRVLWMLAAAKRRAYANNGEIHYKENVYWHDALVDHAGEQVTIRFDPEKLHAPIKVFDKDGRFICDAPCTDKGRFNDTAAAGRHEKNRRNWRKQKKVLADLHRTLTADQVADLYRSDIPPEEAAPIRPTVTRIVTGNLALEPAVDAVSDEMSAEEFEAAQARGLAMILGDSSIIPFPKGNSGPANRAPGRRNRAEK